MVSKLVCLLMLAGVVNISRSFAARVSGDQLPDKTNSAAAETIRSRLQPASDEESKKIKRLIRDLAGIDKPDFGLSATLSGHGFAPIPAAGQVDSGLLYVDHGLSNSPAFLQLVKLGPKSLPFLLDALDSQTPTKLVIRHDDGFGAMWFDHELEGNSANAQEKDALSSLRREERDFEHPMRSYTVKVGDVCFVIVGQIVGRTYNAVRYQPTACIVLNSPTHDALLASRVRSIWSSTNSPQHLLDSLMLDFSTDSTGYHGLKSGAAMRLLYYFPRESTNLIATNLASLSVGRTNHSHYFVDSVAWCQEPSIQYELRKIFERTDDVEVLAASLVAMDSAHRDLYLKRMESFLDNPLHNESGPYGDDYNLLVALGNCFGLEAKPAFQHFIKNADLKRRRSMIKALQATQGKWSVELLTPLLEDKRYAEGWTYAVDPKTDEPRRKIRICDEVAETIALNFPKLSFKMVGEYEDLDAQIEMMQKKIAESKY